MVKTEDNILFFNDLEIYKFDYPIRQVIIIDEVIICRIEPTIGKIMNENVFGISKSGEKLWQIEKMKYIYKDSPFINIYKENKKLILNNWDGLNLVVNYKNGFIEKKEYSR